MQRDVPYDSFNDIKIRVGSKDLFVASISTYLTYRARGTFGGAFSLPLAMAMFMQLPSRLIGGVLGERLLLLHHYGGDHKR